MCEVATKKLEQSHYGMAVNYDGIIDTLINHVIPDHYGITMEEDAEENILTIGSKYSKGRGKNAKEWKDDTKKKDDAATPEVREASSLFLDRWYTKLEEFSQSAFGDGNGQDI